MLANIMSYIYLNQMFYITGTIPTGTIRLISISIDKKFEKWNLYVSSAIAGNFPFLYTTSSSAVISP